MIEIAFRAVLAFLYYFIIIAAGVFVAFKLRTFGLARQFLRGLLATGVGVFSLWKMKVLTDLMGSVGYHLANVIIVGSFATAACFIFGGKQFRLQK